MLLAASIMNYLCFECFNFSKMKINTLKINTFQMKEMDWRIAAAELHPCNVPRTKGASMACPHPFVQQRKPMVQSRPKVQNEPRTNTFPYSFLTST